MIQETLRRERCWLGEIGLLILGKMTWVPRGVLREILEEMCHFGLLIKMLDRPKQQRDPIAIYILPPKRFPAKARKRGEP